MLLQQQSHIWLINGLLAILVLFFSFKTLTIWTVAGGSDPMATSKSKASEAKYIAPAKRPLPRRSLYNDIIKKNLFSKERSAVKSISTLGLVHDKPPAQIPSGLVLFGIVIEGLEKKALVTNLDDKNSKDSVWIQVNDRIGRYIVKEIQTDSILIVGGNSAYTLRLSDGTNPGKPPTGRRNKKPVMRSIQNQTDAKAKQTVDGRKARSRFLPARK